MLVCWCVHVFVCLCFSVLVCSCVAVTMCLCGSVFVCSSCRWRKSFESEREPAVSSADPSAGQMNFTLKNANKNAPTAWG